MTIQAQNHYLVCLIDPNIQRVDRIFVLSYENSNDRTRHTGYFLTKVEVKDHNVMFMVETVLINLLKMIREHMVTLEKNLLV